jgi:hypothetical protein
MGVFGMKAKVKGDCTKGETQGNPGLSVIILPLAFIARERLLAGRITTFY